MSIEKARFPDSESGVWELMLVGAKCTLLITEPSLLPGGFIKCKFITLQPECQNEPMEFDGADVLYIIGLSEQRYKNFYVNNDKVRREDEEKIKLSFEEQRSRIALNKSNLEAVDLQKKGYELSLQATKQAMETNKSIKRNMDSQVEDDSWKEGKDGE